MVEGYPPSFFAYILKGVFGQSDTNLRIELRTRWFRVYAALSCSAWRRARSDG